MRDTHCLVHLALLHFPVASAHIPMLHTLQPMIKYTHIHFEKKKVYVYMYVTKQVKSNNYGTLWRTFCPSLSIAEMALPTLLTRYLRQSSLLLEAASWTGCKPLVSSSVCDRVHVCLCSFHLYSLVYLVVRWLMLLLELISTALLSSSFRHCRLPC